LRTREEPRRQPCESARDEATRPQARLSMAGDRSTSGSRSMRDRLWTPDRRLLVFGPILVLFLQPILRKDATLGPLLTWALGGCPCWPSPFPVGYSLLPARLIGMSCLDSRAAWCAWKDGRHDVLGRRGMVACDMVPSDIPCNDGEKVGWSGCMMWVFWLDL
jgi:hypothetical protein